MVEALRSGISPTTPGGEQPKDASELAALVREPIDMPKRTFRIRLADDDA
jgi:hypothetical protein